MRRSVLALVFAGASLAAACGIGVVGTSEDGAASADDTSRRDGGSPDDARRDGGGPGTGDAADATGDDAADATTQNGDAADAADAGADAGPDAAPPPPVLYDCPGSAAVASCASCAGRPIGCIFCNAAKAYAGVCTNAGAACYYVAKPAGFGNCPCTPPSAAACPPYANQVCDDYAGGYCQPCGDDYSVGSPPFACRGGGSCRAGGVCN